MHLTDSTPITIQRHDGTVDIETTWAEFQTENADDPDTLANIERQIAENNYAEVGGGSIPLVWVFA